MTSLWNAASPDLVVHGDNLDAMRRLPDGAFQVIYLDPPFNTGKQQTRQSVKVKRQSPVEESVEAAELGEALAHDVPPADTDAPASRPLTRTGFQGRSYEHTLGELSAFNDEFADYWGFLEPRLVEAWRLLDQTGTLYLHLDYRESHYAKVVLDALVGRDKFLNEIIWAYDYGARTSKRWPAKHDTILVYVKDPKRYHFDAAEVDREPYMAPGLVTEEKRERGKLPTDVWWHTIVSPTGKERTGYATQKPAGLLRRMIRASSREGDWVADFFGGSGTTAAVARETGRRFVTVDASVDALRTMRGRLGPEGVEYRKLTKDGTRLLSAAPKRARPSR